MLALLDVPLLQQSLKLWLELHDFYNEELPIQDLTAPYGKDVMTLCGSIMIGDPNQVVVAGTLKSIKEHNLPHEILSAEETTRRYPMMRLAPNEACFCQAIFAAHLRLFVLYNPLLQHYILSISLHHQAT